MRSLAAPCITSLSTTKWPPDVNAASPVSDTQEFVVKPFRTVTTWTLSYTDTPLESLKKIASLWFPTGTPEAFMIAVARPSTSKAGRAGSSQLAEIEAPSEAALPSKFTVSATSPVGAAPSTVVSVYGVSVNTWERTLLDTVTSIWKLSDIMIFLSPETFLIPQTMFHVFPMASGISKVVDEGEAKVPSTGSPEFGVATAKCSMEVPLTVTSGRADFERPSTPSSVPPKPRPSKAFAYEAGRAPPVRTLPLKVMNCASAFA